MRRVPDDSRFYRSASHGLISKRCTVSPAKVDHGVAAADQRAQHLGQRTVSQRESAFLDRENLKGQERVFDLG
jgi:hypothetical protein